jgi:RNA 2',3'-cyclic 3'-phosphodiesterase
MSVEQDRADEKRLRVFIAIGLPEKIVSKLGALQQALTAYGLKIRWSRPENIHLTLKFLGDVAGSRIQEIQAAVVDAVKGTGPMTLSVKGIGVFPGVKRPRVLWAGISGQTDALQRLQENLDRHLVALGFEAETRRYTGHLTLGRVKEGRQDATRFASALEEFSETASEPFTVDAVSLYQSRLLPSGPVYTRLFTAGLAGGGFI